MILLVLGAWMEMLHALIRYSDSRKNDNWYSAYYILIINLWRRDRSQANRCYVTPVVLCAFWLVFSTVPLKSTVLYCTVFNFYNDFRFSNPEPVNTLCCSVLLLFGVVHGLFIL